MANFVGLLISALANTAMNKRATFGLGGRTSRREHLQGLAVFSLGIGLTSAALWVLHRAVHHPGRLLEVLVLLVATAIVTVVRFVLFSRWIFAPPVATPHPPHSSGADSAPQSP